MTEPNKHGTTEQKPDSKKPEISPAGPHADERLTDREKTPGTGSLPDAQDADTDVGTD